MQRDTFNVVGEAKSLYTSSWALQLDV